MADPTLIEAAKGVAIVIAACGGLASTVIAATNRKRNDSGNAALLREVKGLRTEVAEVREELTGVRSELIEHKATMLARVSAVEAEVARLRDERHDRANMFQEAVFAAAKLVERKP